MESVITIAGAVLKLMWWVTLTQVGEETMMMERVLQGHVFVFCNSPIAWSSKKQQSVALSSCEAEYIAASLGACQAAFG
jgi:hypothetical protein